MRHLLPLIVLALASPVYGQAPGPQALATEVLHRFARGTPAAFDSVYPDAGGRALVRRAAERGWTRRPDVARVVWSGPGRAVVLLGGVVLVPSNAGDQTNASRPFSGLYEAADSGGAWRLLRRLPLDSANLITSQALTVRLRPGAGVSVVDTLTVRVGARHGLAVRLNHRAVLGGVRVDGRPAEHAFGGGVLWVSVPARAAPRRLVLSYGLAVDGDTAETRAGSFRPAYGHLGFEYVWHPFFDYASTGDVADFRVAVRAPAAFHVATGFPQTSTVRGGVRTVLARSEQPTGRAALVYDREWSPRSVRVGDARFETFTTADFRPSPDSLAAGFARVYRVLQGRFGAPPARYYAVAQARGFRTEGGSEGFYNRLNGLVLAGRTGGELATGGMEPNSVYAHELAHGWTRPGGAAEAFLSEGWADFAESLVIADVLGAETERAFWEDQRNRYHRNGFEGRVAVLTPGASRLIGYYKGSWVLRGLRHALGDSVFDAGMSAYVAIPPGRPAGLDEFAGALSRAAGRDVHPVIVPWLTETTIPDVRARAEGRRVIITQRGPLFHLPRLELEIRTRGGTSTRRLDLVTREDTVELDAPPTSVRVDPQHRYLLRRHWGEMARWELTHPTAREVSLWTSFAPSPIAATREGDRWTVEVPVSEGQYSWAWIVDGRRLPREGASGTQTIRPVRELESPHPR